MTGSPLGVNVAFRSETGQKRRHNEDFVGYYEPPEDPELGQGGRLYVVADGVGGAAAGEIASQYAVRKVLAAYYASDETDLEERLIQAVTAANADIHQAADRRPRPMATTLVAAVARQDELIIANVGDSRAYLVRGGEIRQVTDDHSLVADMVRKGQLTPEEAKNHPRRNLLLRSVGGEAQVKVDVFGGPLLLDDIVVLCTDGLTRYLDEDEIAQAVRTLRPQQAVDQLVQTANERGGKDNITVLVLQVVEPYDDLDTEPRAPSAFPVMPELTEVTTETPNLQTFTRTAIDQRVLSALRSEWAPLALVVAALIVGGLLIWGGLGGSGDTPTPASNQVTGAGGPTQTPSKVFNPEFKVYFAQPAGLHREPGNQSDEVFAAAEGQEAQVLGGPAWDANGAVWWLLRLTRDDGQSVIGWATQTVLDTAP